MRSSKKKTNKKKPEEPPWCHTSNMQIQSVLCSQRRMARCFMSWYSLTVHLLPGLSRTVATTETDNTAACQRHATEYLRGLNPMITFANPICKRLDLT